MRKRARRGADRPNAQAATCNGHVARGSASACVSQWRTTGAMVSTSSMLQDLCASIVAMYGPQDIQPNGR